MHIHIYIADTHQEADLAFLVAYVRYHALVPEGGAVLLVVKDAHHRVLALGDGLPNVCHEGAVGSGALQEPTVAADHLLVLRGGGCTGGRAVGKEKTIANERSVNQKPHSERTSPGS